MAVPSPGLNATNDDPVRRVEDETRGEVAVVERQPVDERKMPGYCPLHRLGSLQGGR